MIKLHIGGGKINFGDSWIHIDAANFMHIQYHNVTKLPFQDNTVNLIYSSHMLEYCDRNEAVDILKEWRRVLQVNGILRLAVPDFAEMSKLYQASKIELKDILGPLYGRILINNKYIYHKTIYDFLSLKELLINIGFKDVKLYDWRSTDHAQFDDCSQAYLCPKGDKKQGVLISLNVECVK